MAAIAEAERVAAGSFNVPKGEWPKTRAPKPEEDAAGITQEILDAFNKSLAEKNFQAIADLFHENGYLRDHLANTWDLRTLKGRDNVKDFLSKKASIDKVEIWKGQTLPPPALGPLDGIDGPPGITAPVSFESQVGKGRGVVRIVDEGHGYKILTLFLSLEELKGHEEPLGKRRPQGVQHGSDPSRRNWLDKRRDELEFKDSEPTVLIIGAGQAGLVAAARLKMLNIPALIIDTNEKVGDNWRKRYHQLVLHDPVWFDQMPYVPFPSHWPVFIAKDKLADFFESYAKFLELNIWTSTSLLSSKWDEKEGKWTVELGRVGADGSTEKRTFQPRHIVQGTGASGKMNFPSVKGMDTFKGDRLCHSSEFTGAREYGKGKKAIVVGAGNSSHDIAQDFYENGYDVTMIQRSSTCVCSSQAAVTGLAPLYSEESPPPEDSDLLLWSYPAELFKAVQARGTQFVKAQVDGPLLDGLNKAGFKTDDGPGGAGLITKYFQRGAGYYIDVGASQMIIDGKIKVKSGQEIVEVLEKGLKFADGEQLEADEIIFATGYQSMRTQAKVILGDDVYNRVSDVWGWDKEGEFCGVYKRSGHPGFWFFGGNLALSRYFSKMLAFQIKAIELGYASRDPTGKDGPTVKKT